MEIGLAEGEPSEDGVAHVDVDDLKAEAERLRAAGVEVGIVVELGGEMRLLDVFDPDGNRLQFAQELRGCMLRPVDRQDMRFLRDMLRHAYHWRIAEDPDRPRLPLRPELGTARRRRRDRLRRPERVRRGVVPALPGERARASASSTSRRRS